MRPIHIVRCSSGQATSFLDTMKGKTSRINYIYPHKYLILTEVPSYQDLRSLTIREKVKNVANVSEQDIDRDGWTGECLIFDLTDRDIVDDIYGGLNMATDEHLCRNLWLFSSEFPNVDPRTVRHQRFYQIEEVSDGTSKLSAVNYLEVVMSICESQ